MEKKKGFTLVELITAIAILSIIIVPLSQISMLSYKTTANNSKNIDLYNLNQYIMQTLKSKGKNYMKFLYSGSNSYEGYFYFNDKDDASSILESNSFTSGTYSQMVSNGSSSNKSYGCCLQLSTSSTIGQKGDGTDITLNSGLDTVKIYVKVVKIGQETDKNSDLIFYMGR